MASNVRNLNRATDTLSLREQAYQLLDANDFAGARDLYRAAAMLDLPDERALGNLAVAEGEERLQFRRALYEKHHSLVAKMSVIHALFIAKHYDSVLRECTDLLTKGDLTVVEDLRIRWLRFRSALRTFNFPRDIPLTVIAEDFWWLWFITMPKLVERSRNLLLIEVAQVQHTHLIPVLESLADDARLPPPAQKFLQAKVHELQLLQAVTS